MYTVYLIPVGPYTFLLSSDILSGKWKTSGGISWRQERRARNSDAAVFLSLTVAVNRPLMDQLFMSVSCVIHVGSDYVGYY